MLPAFLALLAPVLWAGAQEPAEAPPGVLLDGRESPPELHQALPDAETVPLLRRLFPHRPGDEVVATGSFRGAFTAPGRDQVFLLGCWRDPAFSGTGATVEGEVRCGVFEGGRLLAMRRLPSARNVKGFRAVDLDGNGLLEVLGCDLYEATGWGQADLWILGADRTRLRVWRRFRAYSYASTDERQRAWTIAYAGGALHTVSSYRMRAFIRPLVWVGKGEAVPEIPWKESGRAFGEPHRPER